MSTRGMTSILGRDRGDLDFVEHLRLERAHLIQADQLEQRQKRNHNLNPRDDLAKQFLKTHWGTAVHALQDLFNLVRHAETLTKYFAQIFPRLDPFDHFLKGVNQLKNPNFVQRQWRI